MSYSPSPRRTIVRCLIALSVLAAPTVAQERRPFTSEDALDVASLSVEAITRDGRYVAAIQSTRRDRLEVDHLRFGDPTYVAPRLGEVLVINAETGVTRRLFESKVQATAFAWSPDGATLALLRIDGDDVALYTYDVGRDRTRAVELRTDKPIATTSPLEWRPDGSGLLLSLREGGWNDESRRAFLALTDGPIIVQDSREPFLGWDAVRNRNALVVPAVIELPDRTVRELLPEGPWSIESQTRDGQYTVYRQSAPQKTSYVRAEGTEYTLQLVDMSSSEARRIGEPATRRLTREWNESGDRFAYASRGNVFVQSIADSAPANLTEEHRTPVSESDTTKLSYSLEGWRPDGAMLFVKSKRGFHLLDPTTKSIELVLQMDTDSAGTPNHEVVHWSENGRYVFFAYSAKDRWERGLVRYDLQTRTMSDLIKDANLYRNWEFSEDGQRVFYSFSDGDVPADLYVADASLSQPRRLTDLNGWLASRTLTKSELVPYLDVDGDTLYGILYYPVDYQPNRRYPLVAEVYERFFDNGFNSNMNLIANAGFFGFRPSVDLEIGYPGEAWLKGVTAGINRLIDRGLVDPDKIGVHGTSYGGYATNLLVTQTDRFAAAINISGKVNIISFLGDSPKITTRNYNAAEEGQDRLGATLWEQPQKYVAHTAIFNADRIETPLLLLSGEGDWNVPATNQREMYYALRRLGKEVVWVHYMRGGHGAGAASNADDFHDQWRRIIGWYNEHFFATETADKVAETTGSGASRQR